MASPARSILRPRDIGLIHLKSQALVNLFFGIPMVTLVLPFWGLPLVATVKVTSIYLLVYICYFVPLWLIVPHILLKPARPVLRHIDKGHLPDDLKLKKTIEFLLNYPFYSSIRQYFLIISGFILGSLFIPFGAVSELLPIETLAIIYVLVIGLVVSLIEAFLNFTFLENYMAKTISGIVTLRPVLAIEPFDSRRISLLRKMVFVILGTVIAAQLIILIFIVGKLAIDLPESVGKTIAYLGSFMLLTAGYVVLAAVLFTRNISSPLRQLIDWSSRVSAGDRSRLALVTNDEINDVALYSNQMVANLGNLTAWLEQERDQLTSEKNKLSAVLSRVADGVVATDSKGEILLFNKAMELLSGWSEAETIGKPVDQVLSLYRESGRLYSLAEVIGSKGGQADRPQIKKSDLRLVNRSQENKYVILSSTAIGNADGQGVGRILTFHDITEERELERMKIDFVSMAAHELRTPLTSIKGYLDILNKELSGKVSKEEMMFLSRSLLGANQLSSLIENLLNVSRIERGALRLEVAPISLSKLAGNVIDSLAELARHNQIKILLSVSKKDDRLVMADHFRIAEVLTNLIANAIAYSPTDTEITVRMQSAPDGKSAMIKVADQGHGIPPEAQTHLFTKFYRVAGELSQGSKGTGLGLFISKAIIDAHHGRIWVESKVGKGSVFSFTLPYAPEGSEESQFAKPPTMLKKSKSGGSTNQLV